MDKITRQIRIEHWTQIMNECLNSGMNKTEVVQGKWNLRQTILLLAKDSQKEAFAASTSKELSVITDPTVKPVRKISFAR